MPNTQKIAIQLAALLLLEHGYIALSDILSLPFVEDEEQALQIAQKLVDSFGDDYELEVPPQRHPSDISVRLTGSKMHPNLLA